MNNDLIFINKKEFLAKDAVFSTSAIHSKMYQEKLGSRPKLQLRVSDCNNAIRLWNYCDTDEDREEFVEKIDTMLKHLSKFRRKIGDEFDKEFNDKRFKL